MLTTLILAGALLAPSQTPDKWDLKAGLAPKTSLTWHVVSNVTMGSEQHTATMKFVEETKGQDAGKPLNATVSWRELTLENGQPMDDNSWDLTLDPHGMITDSQGNDADAVRKMLTPFLFAYPDAPVAVGDTWTVTAKGGTDKDDASITEVMKVDSMDKVGDTDAMKVKETLSQKGTNGLSGSGTWWVDKTGKVLKFDVTVTNWEVTLVPGQMDAEMKGDLAK